MPNEALRTIAARGPEGLAVAATVTDFAVVRQPAAYPVYDGAYRAALGVISSWLKTLTNFETVGRSGLHLCDNQDHSMLSAMYGTRFAMVGPRVHDI